MDYPDIKFVHITKTAGTVIEDVGYKNGYFWGRYDYFYLDTCKKSKYLDASSWHIPIRYLDFNPYPSSILFTVVRNPFAFILSTFYYARKHKGHFMHTSAMSMPFRDFPAYYLKTMVQHATSRPYGSNKVTSLYNWILNKDGV